TLKMPAFEWVHVQLHQQKGMISLSPPTICNSAVALLPWRDSMDDLRADLAHVKDAIGASVASKWTAIIHAPVNGVVLGIPDHGFDGKELASYGFGLVLAGHYHNHKKIGTVANSRW
ncbi:hypothetical protein LIZ07_24145, partial [Escherichia coli]|nr:hypothetical protein [Escherichia coli]MCB7034206.1 hypothetical protein [Escherichia coli]MCB7048746.1 hypothetical protein [Escherichia coli]